MNFLQQDSQWTPPPEELLNFTRANCFVADRWYWAWLTAEGHADPSRKDARSNVATGLVIDYLSSLIPKNYTPKPSAKTKILFWYDEMPNTLFYNLSKFPYYNCQTAICRNINWPGDPDITGVGVSRCSRVWFRLLSSY